MLFKQYSEQRLYQIGTLDCVIAVLSKREPSNGGEGWGPN